jgi:hypothetical protein
MRENKKMMTRKKDGEELQEGQNGQEVLLRRSPMERLIFDKNESQMMRAPNWKVMTWQP